MSHLHEYRMRNNDMQKYGFSVEGKNVFIVRNQ